MVEQYLHLTGRPVVSDALGNELFAASVFHRHVADVWNDNYSGLLLEYPSVAYLSYRNLWLCPHRKCPNDRVGAPLPRFGLPQLDALAKRLVGLDLSKCGLCDLCVKEMQLDRLTSLVTLNLACNRLRELPQALTSMPACVEELHVAANRDLSLRPTESRLRQNGARWPVLPNLKVRL